MDCSPEYVVGYYDTDEQIQKEEQEAKIIIKNKHAKQIRTVKSIAPSLNLQDDNEHISVAKSIAPSLNLQDDNEHISVARSMAPMIQVDQTPQNISEHTLIARQFQKLVIKLRRLKKKQAMKMEKTSGMSFHDEFIKEVEEAKKQRHEAELKEIVPKKLKEIEFMKQEIAAYYVSTSKKEQMIEHLTKEFNEYKVTMLGSLKKTYSGFQGLLTLLCNRLEEVRNKLQQKWRLFGKSALQKEFHQCNVAINEVLSAMTKIQEEIRYLDTVFTLPRQ